jgi:aspartyl-tRNA(Asn)/glutamyl-tRNA(Gln) amidotransferase subunit A
MSILDLTAVALGKKIRSGEVTSPEAAKAVLARMKALEPVLNCYVTIDEEQTLEQAARVQKEIEEGRLTGPLAGVPVAVKDNLCTEGMRTTCCSRILENFTPAYTAEAVENLKKAGAVILGKTNMDEFAMGSTTETSAFGVTRNPWNLDHVPGGSSGGSCAAVAAGEAFYALGSDTGGSIRQPSAFCGVTGIKPTYGTVSRYGLIAYGSSLDQIGPVAKDVTDCAAILEAVSSYDKKDSTSMERKDLDFTSALVEDVRGLRIGIPRDYFGEGLDSEVKEAVLKAAQVLAAKGAVVEEFDLSLVEYAIPAYYVIASAEASSNLSRFDGVKYGYRTREYEGLHSMYKKSRSQGFGPEVKRRIMLGSFVLSSGYYDAYYLKALRTKALIKQAFDRAFARFDVILGPAAPTTAPRLGESLSDPLKMYLGDIYTISVNLAGLPAMTLPCGIGSKGLPIGLQLIGDCFQEKKIIRAAYTYERTRSYQAPALDGYLAAGQPGAAGGSEPGAAGGGCPGTAGGSEPGAAGGGCPGAAGGSEPEAAETSRQTAATEQEVQ